MNNTTPTKKEPDSQEFSTPQKQYENNKMELDRLIENAIHSSPTIKILSKVPMTLERYTLTTESKETNIVDEKRRDEFDKWKTTNYSQLGLYRKSRILINDDPREMDEYDRFQKSLNQPESSEKENANNQINQLDTEKKANLDKLLHREAVGEDQDLMKQLMEQSKNSSKEYKQKLKRKYNTMSNNSNNDQNNNKIEENKPQTTQKQQITTNPLLPNQHNPNNSAPSQIPSSSVSNPLTQEPIINPSHNNHNNQSNQISGSSN